MENNVSFDANFTNSSFNATKDHVDPTGPDFYNSPVYRTIVVILLSVVMILGVLGNLAVVIAVSQRHRNIKSPSNYLIMNIAVADFLVAVVVTPLRFVEIYGHGWPLGGFMCRFLAPLQDVMVCVSVVTHTVIALERYRVIVTPFKPKMSIFKTKQVIVIIWLVCYTASGLPVALVLGKKRSGGIPSCIVEWPSDATRQAYIVYLVVVFIVIPLIIQTYAYSITVTEVSHEIMSCTQTESNTRAIKMAQRKARTVQMLILLVVVFQVCSIPRAFTMLLWEFVPRLRSDVPFQYGITITVIVYYLKHVVNPFIIFATSSEFRASFCYCLHCGLEYN